MTRFGTIDPPAVISFFVPSLSGATATNVAENHSLAEASIHSLYREAQREVCRYRAYCSRWDGYRAEPFEPGLLEETARILEVSELLSLDAGVRPELVTTGPASDGSIDVEIEALSKRLVLTLYPDEPRIRVTLADAKARHEETVTLGTAALVERLSWVYRTGGVSALVAQNRSAT
jgi:hypothetical protein